jgi:fatty acid desaturase
MRCTIVSTEQAQPTTDLDSLAEALNSLGRELRRDSGPDDIAHLKRMKRWTRAATALGYATAWIAPNPVSVLALSTGRFARWTMVAHHVGHRGYDKIEGGPRGAEFAQGWRRWLQWPDWIVPEAWKYEHNKMHHYRLNETADPDLVEHKLDWLRQSDLPMPAKLALVAFFASTWKFVYYAPSTLAALRQEDDPAGDPDGYSWVFDPRTKTGRELWQRSYLPYVLGHFVIIPTAFGLVLGPVAAMNVAANSAMAEVLTNLHTFAVIVPNHVGDDLYRFSDRYRGKGEFYLRQVLGSANYRTGGELNDFLHGFLNYQIEHHLWPDLSMVAYQKAQPKVEQICKDHGIPYVQQSVFQRVRKTVRVMVGAESMRRYPPHAPAVAD